MRTKKVSVSTIVRQLYSLSNFVIATVDEQLQVAGAEAFNRFQKYVLPRPWGLFLIAFSSGESIVSTKRFTTLQQPLWQLIELTRLSQLRNFSNAARQLGSSVGILSSAFRLRECLAQILFIFRDNAADLFPRKVSRQQRECLVNPNLMDRKRKAQRRKSSSGRVQANLEDTLDLESLPEHFENFAAALMSFLKCLNEFPEFTDEAVNTSIKSFEGDLKVYIRPSCRCILG